MLRVVSTLAPARQLAREPRVRLSARLVGIDQLLESDHGQLELHNWSSAINIGLDCRLEDLFK